MEELAAKFCARYLRPAARAGTSCAVESIPEPPPLPGVPPAPQMKCLCCKPKDVPVEGSAFLLSELLELFTIYCAAQGHWYTSSWTSKQSLLKALNTIGAPSVQIEGKPAFAVSKVTVTTRSKRDRRYAVAAALRRYGVTALWDVPLLTGNEVDFAFIYGGWLRRCLYALDVDSPSVFEFTSLGHSADAFTMARERDLKKTATVQTVAYYLRIDSDALEPKKTDEGKADGKDSEADIADRAVRELLSRALASMNWSTLTLATPSKYAWLFK